jgi:hypothetical protein
MSSTNDIDYEEIIRNMNDDDYIKAYKNYFKSCPRKVLEDEMDEIYHTLDYYTNNDNDDNNYFIHNKIDLRKYINIKKCSLSKMKKCDLIDYCKKIHEDNKYIQKELNRGDIENEKLKEENEKNVKKIFCYNLGIEGLKKENEELKKENEKLKDGYDILEKIKDIIKDLVE